MKINKKISTLKKMRAVSAAVAIAGFFGMLGAAGSLDTNTVGFGQVMILLCSSMGLFIIGFLMMKYCEDAINSAIKQQVKYRKDRAYKISSSTPRRHNIA